MHVNSPLVTVIIPLYNREQFISQAIESVLDQTFQDFELLIVDDGSTDSGLTIAQQYAATYPSKLICLNHKHRRNYGPGATRNLGIRNAKGRYLAFLDSDDVWLPEKLEVQVDILNRNPEAGLTYCPIMVIDEYGEPTKELLGAHLFGSGVPEKSHYMFESLFSRTFAFQSCSTALIRKEYLHHAGLFDEDLRNGQDNVLSWKIAYLTPFFFWPQALVKYRVHRQNITWDYLLHGKGHKIQYQATRRVCEWLRANSEEYQTQTFRIKLANLCYDVYQKHLLSQWGYYRLLLYLFPYKSANWSLVKMFITLFLGYNTTHKLQTGVKFFRHLFKG